MKSSNIFTICPGAPFLQTLADSLCSGRLIPDFKDNGDPLFLSDVTIYLPTRRAVRALRGKFTERNGGKTAILPNILALGEFEDDDGFFDDNSRDALDLNPAIAREERILELSRLVRHWAEFLPAHIRQLFGTDAVMLPATSADAVWLARNLADLMDEVSRENGNWSALQSLIPDELSQWWQLTLEFMKIISEIWPQFLRDNSLSNAIDYRNNVVRLDIDRLLSKPMRGPIIAAGSTGSIPATAHLLKSIGSLSNGAVILPGLDQMMDDSSWDELFDEKTGIDFGHPQYGLKKLLHYFGVLRSDVIELGVISDQIQARNRLVSRALLPAHSTHQWINSGKTDLPHVSEIVASNEAEEALSIAIALREAIELGAIPAALVTTDRGLARRVSSELERFGIRADDSGGIPLENTQSATLFRLMLEVVFKPFDPLSLLSLLKHPMLRLNKDRQTTRNRAEILELLFLRGDVIDLQLSTILKHMQSPPQSHPPEYIKRLSVEETEGALDLGNDFEQAIAPLKELSENPQKITVSKACLISVEVFEALARDEQGSISHLYAGNMGEGLAKLFRSLIQTKADFTFSPHEWPSIYNALIAGQAVNPKASIDNRVYIWGALEARLQHMQTIILGGLNEKIWPIRAKDDPLLSRSMKAGIALEPPERRIGLAAHDFQILLGTKNVILSRAHRLEGAPSVASRWLQRLHGVMGKESVRACQLRGEKYLNWARHIDGNEPKTRADRPCPKPSVALRPIRFSVSDIALLRRDPYALHAKRILGLTALKPLLREPGPSERGQLFHKIVEEFVRCRISSPGTEAELSAIGKRLFDEEDLPVETYALWWRRFERMSGEFIAFETQRAPDILKSYVELSSQYIPISNTGASLHARADRIDRLVDNSCEIIDYKTGVTPSAKQVIALIEPQLALEAALLERGGFLKAAMCASELIYVSLKSDGSVSEARISQSTKPPQTASQIGARAWEKLISIVQFYSNENNGYLSRLMPLKENSSTDYDHLARVAEWSSGDGDDEDDEA
jgi:ATP-dependent helicase/nuclease subunit B